MASSEGGIRWVTEGPADVVVVPGEALPNGLDVGVARLAVGGCDPGADLTVGLEEFASDPTHAVRRAWAARMALRPRSDDAPERWLEAVRIHLGADVAARAERGGLRTVGADGVQDELRGLASDARERLRVWRTRESLPASSGGAFQAAAAVPLGTRGELGVLVVAVTHGGASWADGVGLPLRAVAAATAWRAAVDALAAERAQHAESDQLLRDLLRIASHDLGNTLFASRLAARTLARQGEAPRTVEALERSLGTAIAQLKRVVEAGRAVLDGFRPVPGTTELRAAFDRVASEIARVHSERTISGAPPSERVAIGPATAERLLSAVLNNAAVHGDPEEPVFVEGAREGNAVRVVVRNRGMLPFGELDRIEPFEHRRGPGLGFDLWYARRLAEVAGVALSLRSADDEVVATLTIPVA